MIYELEETAHDNEAETLFRKTPGLINPEPYVLTQNRFTIYIVLVFNELNKVQFYKMPCGDSPYLGNVKLMRVVRV